ncbi:hypothetical protein RRG08_064569 [Elysia crispata]|uniref:Uncharacterized protein n=1 Tax=Elysia crispata TaxID=231223 RepID=A0AAE1ECT3_9GAST|nr:hypothetical protein RRG08_064569 [Elysia crispata]
MRREALDIETRYVEKILKATLKSDSARVIKAIGWFKGTLLDTHHSKAALVRQVLTQQNPNHILIPKVQKATLRSRRGQAVEQRKICSEPHGSHFTPQADSVHYYPKGTESDAVQQERTGRRAAQGRTPRSVAIFRSSAISFPPGAVHRRGRDEKLTLEARVTQATMFDPRGAAAPANHRKVALAFDQRCTTPTWHDRFDSRPNRAID